MARGNSQRSAADHCTAMLAWGLHRSPQRASSVQHSEQMAPRYAGHWAMSGASYSRSHTTQRCTTQPWWLPPSDARAPGTGPAMGTATGALWRAM